MTKDSLAEHDLKLALSQIRDYCKEYDISGCLARTMFEIGISAYRQMQQRGFLNSASNMNGENRPEQPPSSEAA